MADDKQDPRAAWIPVSIRLRVPRGMSPLQILDIVQRECGLLSSLEYERDQKPVPVRLRRADPEFLASGGQFFIVYARIDPHQVATLTSAPHVDHVTREARLEPFQARGSMTMFGSGGRRARAGVDCGSATAAAGTSADVARELGVSRLRAAGLTGRGVVVGVVDGGITAHGRPTAVGGWPAIPQPPAVGDVVAGWPTHNWGTTADGWGQHGNMIAFDVQAMAPEAELWDIRIFEPSVAFVTYMRNAIQGYQLAIAHYRAHGVPQILVNSWGLYDSGNGPDYAFDPNGDFAVVVEEALDAGILILFAAGNCGDGCRFSEGTPCGIGDRGPAASILGPNGHPEVMTVGAATLGGDWCGFTSQGPAALPPNDPDKPDFCSISQFAGFFPNESGLRRWDGGTSAATAIAAGVVALLKQARPGLTQDECKRLLKETARPIRIAAAQGGAGAGIIDAMRAFRAL